MAEFTTIDECVNIYLDRSEQDTTKYMKCWHIAFSGMEQLGLDFFYRIKSVKLPVNGNLTINLPEDYINYSKVGVFNERGAIIPLIYNDQLSTYADLDPERKNKTEDKSLWDLSYLNTSVFMNYWDGWNFTTFYGLPSGSPWVGTFKIDRANNLIILGDKFQYPYIVLEYISSPAPDRGGNYVLPAIFKEALIAYIGWQDIMYMPTTRRGSLGDKEQRRRNYRNERRLARARYQPLRLEEAYELNLQMQRLTVKG